MDKQYFVYILTNKCRDIFYIGVTNELSRRMYEHKNKLIEGFTKKYNIDVLIYYEIYNHINDAIKREKQLKSWHREWKLNLIKENNPKLNELLLKIN